MVNNRGRELETSRGSGSDAQAITGARTRFLPRTIKGRVPPTFGSTQGASHDPNLYHQVIDEDGTVHTYYEIHPNGNRRQRRYRLRHHPFFTKTRTGGRDWQVRIKELSRARSLDTKKLESPKDPGPAFYAKEQD